MDEEEKTGESPEHGKTESSEEAKEQATDRI
jgi:hypothetical protein